MKYFKAALLIMLTMASAISAQEKLTLDECVSIALRENLSIQIAENASKIAENNYHPGNANLLPRLDLSSSATYNDNETNTNGATKNSAFTTNIVGLRATYTLFDGFGNTANYEKLKYLRDMSDLEQRDVIERTITKTVSTFYETARLSELVNIEFESLEISRDRLERVKNKQQYGQARSVDYLSALVDLNRDSVNYINTKTQLHHAKQRLNALLNREVDTDFYVELEVQFETIGDKETITNSALERNAAYKLALQNIKLSETDISIANANYLPILSLDANYGYNKTVDEFGINYADRNKNFSVGLNLSYNIFNGFRNSIQSQNAEIRFKNSELSEKAALLEMMTEISNTYQQYSDELVTLKLEKQNLQSAETNFLRTKELYELGQVTLTQFRESQLNFIRAKLNIANITYSVKVFEAELKRLAGILL